MMIFVGVAVFQAAFGQGTGPVLLSYVRCTGADSSLLRCSRIGTYLHQCSHSQDAGVVCPPCKLCGYIIYHEVTRVLCLYVGTIHTSSIYLCLHYNARFHNIDILHGSTVCYINLKVWHMRLLNSFIFFV